MTNSYTLPAYAPDQSGSLNRTDTKMWFANLLSPCHSERSEESPPRDDRSTGIPRRRPGALGRGMTLAHYFVKDHHGVRSAPPPIFGGRIPEPQWIVALRFAEGHLRKRVSGVARMETAGVEVKAQ